jgi:hypothetical protein
MLILWIVGCCLTIQLEKFQKVTISLFNFEDKLVNVLYDGDMREGENIFSFDKTSLNQGFFPVLCG